MVVEECKGEAVKGCASDDFVDDDRIGVTKL